MPIYHMTSIGSAVNILNDAYRVTRHEMDADAAMKFLDHPDGIDNQHFFASYGCLMRFRWDGRVVNEGYARNRAAPGNMYFNGQTYFLSPTAGREQIPLIFLDVEIFNYQRIGADAIHIPTTPADRQNMKALAARLANTPVFVEEEEAVENRPSTVGFLSSVALGVYNKVRTRLRS
jgi:hypothetical protein